MASTTESAEQKKLMLRIDDTVHPQLRQHGEETYPHECCGVLLGHALDGINEVETAIRTAILAPIPPTIVITLRLRNWLVSNAAPGARSRRLLPFPSESRVLVGDGSPEAHWLGCSYVITSVEKGVAVKTNSFLFAIGEDDKRFVDEEIQVLPEHCDRRPQKTLRDREEKESATSEDSHSYPPSSVRRQAGHG